MSDNRDDLTRLLAGDVSGDPSDRAVADFLAGLDRACPTPPVTGLQERHLALIAATVQEEAAAGRTRATAAAARRRLRRSVATGVTAVLGVLTAGVGVAAALGANPLPALLPGLVAQPPAVPTAPPGLAQRNEPDRGRPIPSRPPTQPGEPGRPETIPPVTLPSQATGPKSEPGAASENGKAKGRDTNNGKANGKDSDNGKKPQGRPTARPGKSPTARPASTPAVPGAGRPSSGAGD